MPSLSWPSVIVGAALLGGILGAVQTDASPPPPGPPAAPTPAPAPVPAPQPADDAVRTTLPSATSAQVALTFDDGPDPQWTPLVLDELARHGVPATFCVVGEQLDGQEALVRRIHAEGHRLCNHTQSHDDGLPVRDPAEVDAEISAVTDRLHAIVPDADVSVFRAPGGRFDPTVVATAAAQGLASWGWSVDPRDWSSTDPDQVVADVLDGVTPGAVVLLHDGGGDRAATVAALTEVVPLLQSVGYEFVVLP